MPSRAVLPAGICDELFRRTTQTPGGRRPLVPCALELTQAINLLDDPLGALTKTCCVSEVVRRCLENSFRSALPHSPACRQGPRLTALLAQRTCSACSSLPSSVIAVVRSCGPSQLVRSSTPRSDLRYRYLTSSIRSRESRPRPKYSAVGMTMWPCRCCRRMKLRYWSHHCSRAFVGRSVTNTTKSTAM
jgi:hypothetical protein